MLKKILIIALAALSATPAMAIEYQTMEVETPPIETDPFNHGRDLVAMTPQAAKTRIGQITDRMWALDTNPSLTPGEKAALRLAGQERVQEVIRMKMLYEIIKP